MTEPINRRRLYLHYNCDVCGKKRSKGGKGIDHSRCSKIRQERHREYWESKEKGKTP